MKVFGKSVSVVIMMMTDRLLWEAHVNRRLLGGSDGGERWDLVIVSWVGPFPLLLDGQRRCVFQSGFCSSPVLSMVLILVPRLSSLFQKGIGLWSSPAFSLLPYQKGF